MKAMVAAWVGSTNLGDELLFRVVRDRLRGLGCNVVAPSVDPDATRTRHEVAAFRDRDVMALVREVGEADLVVFGGGGLLQDETSPFNLPYHLSRLAVARLRRTPIVGIGLGAGPLTTRAGRAQVRAALRPTARAPVPVVVRDQDSADVLRDVGLAPTLGADLAFSLTVDPPPLRDVIGVALRPWSGGGTAPVHRHWEQGLDDEAFQRALAGALDTSVERLGLEVEMIAFQSDRDVEVHQRVADRMRHADRVTFVAPTVETVLDTVGSTRGVVSMRYHGGATAALAGRPSLLIGYSTKVSSLADDLGGAATVVGTGAGSRTSVQDDLADEIEAMVSDAPRRSELAHAAVERLRVREQANLEALEATVAAAIAAAAG